MRNADDTSLVEDFLCNVVQLKDVCVEILS